MLVVPFHDRLNPFPAALVKKTMAKPGMEYDFLIICNMAPFFKNHVTGAMWI